MALDYMPRGDKQEFTNLGSAKIKTWPIKNSTVPTNKNGAGSQSINKKENVLK